MRVLYFTRDYCPHDYRFLKAISECGDEVFYVHLLNNHYESRPLPAAVREIPWGVNPDDEDHAVRRIRQIWDEIRPDVIHSGPLTDTAYITAKAGLHPHAAMSWGFDLGREIESSAILRERARIALADADWIIGDCQMELDTAEKLGYDRTRSVVFPWGIDTARFSYAETALRDSLVKKGEFLVLSLRTMEPNYSVETVVRGFLLAAKEQPGLRLILLGDGSQMEMLRKIAAEDPNGDRVYFLGRQPNEMLVDYYRSADLYVSASIVDGSSVSLLEAMGCGTPVLVSRIPGNEEWVTDGVTGLFFPVGDTDAFAEKLLWSCRNPEKLESMSRNARNLIENKADWDKNKILIRKAYEKAIERCRQ